MYRGSKGITQFYLSPPHEPYLPLLPSHRPSPPFGWYSLSLPTEGWPGCVYLQLVIYWDRFPAPVVRNPVRLRENRLKTFRCTRTNGRRQNIIFLIGGGNECLLWPLTGCASAAVSEQNWLTDNDDLWPALSEKTWNQTRERAKVDSVVNLQLAHKCLQQGSVYPAMWWLVH